MCMIYSLQRFLIQHIFCICQQLDLPLPYSILYYYVLSMSDSCLTKLPKILHAVCLPMVHPLSLCQNSFLLARILVILFYIHLGTTYCPCTIHSQVSYHVLMHILRTLHFCGYTKEWYHLQIV